MLRLPTKVRAWFGYVLTVSLPCLALGWLSAKVHPFFEDDSLISLRYAERLLAGHGLTWTPGEAVEGYSNLLWVLLCAALGACGLDLVLAARVLGVSCLLLAFVALVLRHRPERSYGGAAPALVATGLLGLSAPAAVWAIGGLEQPLFCALLAVALWRAALELEPNAVGPQRSWLLPLSLALLCLTRPDAPLFVVLIGLGVSYATRRFHGTRAAVALGCRTVAPALLVVLVHLAFRVAYYGDYVPNTAYVKTHVSEMRLFDGLAYLKAGFGTLWPVLLLAGLAALVGLATRARRLETLLLLALAGSWLGYIALIGGDHFPCHRHLLVVVLLAAFLIGLAVERSFYAGRLFGLLALAIVGGASVPFVQLQLSDPGFKATQWLRWQWDGQVVGELFGTTFSKAQPLWAVTAAGCLPYFSKLPALDMLGLNDRHIARTPPVEGYGLAHDHGDGAYVLDRRPDLITFGLPEGGLPSYLSGDQMQRDPRFGREYRRVRFEGLTPYRVVSETYVRLRGRVGIESSADRIRYPAYLLEGNIFGRRVASGAMGARLPAGERAQTRRLKLNAGTYRISLVPENVNVSIDLRLERGAAQVSRSLLLTVRRSASLRVGLLSPRLDTSIEALSIERLDAPAPQVAGVSRELSDSSVVVRPALEPEMGSVRQLGHFDAGIDGWTPQGTASRWWVQVPPAKQGTIRGYDGGFIDTFGARGGDRLVGTLSSQDFLVPDAAWLSVKMAGSVGTGFGTRVGLRLLEGTAIRDTVSAAGKGDLELRRVDLAAYAGRRLHLEIVDASRRGHLLVDGVELMSAAAGTAGVPSDE